jgi:hypothetical protein
MHTNQTHNILVIDDWTKIKFPREIVEWAASIDWQKLEWNTLGLPAFYSAFSLTGNQLYYEHGPDGKPSLHQSDFTGTTLSSTVIAPEKCESVFVLTMKLEFCKGILCDSDVVESITKPRSEYDAGFRAFVESNERAIKTLNSFWFKCLYRPYYLCVKWTTIGVVSVGELLLKSVVWCAEKITPIKF